MAEVFVDKFEFLDSFLRLVIEFTENFHHQFHIKIELAKLLDLIESSNSDLLFAIAKHPIKLLLSFHNNMIRF